METESYHIIEDNILFSMSSTSAVVKLNGEKNSRMVFNICLIPHFDKNKNLHNPKNITINLVDSELRHK